MFLVAIFAVDSVYLVNYTGLQGFVVEKLWVVSEVIFDVESELAYHVRILRYFRLCAREMGFFAIFEVMYRAQEIFWFFSQMSSFSPTLSLQNELLNSHERFFFTKIRPYQVFTFIRTSLWAFTLTLWCIPFCIRKFVSTICACGFWWSVNKNLQSEIFGPWEILGCLF